MAFGARRLRRLQRGTISLELVITAPVLLGLISLIVAFGRFGGTESVVEQAARDGARVATQTQNKDEAYAAAEDTVEETLEQAPSSSCSDEKPTVSIDTTDGFAASDPYETDDLNMLTITVTCRVDLGELMFLPIGEVSVTRSFTSPFDVFRAYYE